MVLTRVWRWLLRATKAVVDRARGDSVIRDTKSTLKRLNKERLDKGMHKEVNEIQSAMRTIERHRKSTHKGGDLGLSRKRSLTGQRKHSMSQTQRKSLHKRKSQTGNILRFDQTELAGAVNLPNPAPSLHKTTLQRRKTQTRSTQADVHPPIDPFPVLDAFAPKKKFSTSSSLSGAVVQHEGSFDYDLPPPPFPEDDGI